MVNTFREQMRTKLLRLKQEIFEHLAKENEEFKAILEDKDPKDLADIASDDIGRSTLEALEAQEVRRLNLIDAALARLENGHYGMCMACSKKIPTERLEAIPYALMCVSCKSSEERRNR